VLCDNLEHNTKNQNHAETQKQTHARRSRVEAASALSECIGKEITWRCKKRLGNIDGKTDAKEMWAAGRQLTGRQQKAAIID